VRVRVPSSQTCLHYEQIISAPPSPVDGAPIFCLIVNIGGENAGCETTISRRKVLLVEVTSGDNNNDGRTEELVGVYEAAAGAARRNSAKAAEAKTKTKEEDDALYRSSSRAHCASVLCPFFGVVRVGATAAAGRGPFRPLVPTAGEQGTRLCLALGDPREGMRCPCTLTIKIKTAGASASSALPPQVTSSTATRSKHLAGTFGTSDWILHSTKTWWLNAVRSPPPRFPAGSEWQLELSLRRYGLGRDGGRYFFSWDTFSLGSNSPPLSRKGVGQGPRPSRVWRGFRKV